MFHRIPPACRIHSLLPSPCYFIYERAGCFVASYPRCSRKRFLPDGPFFIVVPRSPVERSAPCSSLRVSSRAFASLGSRIMKDTGSLMSSRSAPGSLWFPGPITRMIAVQSRCTSATSRWGYIPAKMNHELALLMHFGHGNTFECVVTQAAPDAHPQSQVRTSIFIKDARQERDLLALEQPSFFRRSPFRCPALRPRGASLCTLFV